MQINKRVVLRTSFFIHLFVVHFASGHCEVSVIDQATGGRHVDVQIHPGGRRRGQWADFVVVVRGDRLEIVYRLGKHHRIIELFRDRLVSLSSQCGCTLLFPLECGTPRVDVALVRRTGTHSGLQLCEFSFGNCLFYSNYNRPQKKDCE